MLSGPDGHVLKRALEFEVEGQIEEGGSKRTCTKTIVEV